MLKEGPQFYQIIFFLKSTGIITHYSNKGTVAFCNTECAHFCIILWPQLQGPMEVDRAWDSCKAHCYVVNACWNSQINGRGSSPNQGSIPGYILVLWAVIHSGRHQYLLLPWHGDRQDKRGWQPSWYLSLPGVTSCQIEEILLFVAQPPWDCCFLERLESGRYTERDV